MLACSLSPAPAKKKMQQCRLRFVPNFIPARQQAVNPLAGSGSPGPRASLRVPQVYLPGGCPKVTGRPGPQDAQSGGARDAALTLAGGRARRGSPCPRGRGWVRWPPARAVRGARLRARAAGSAVQSARACRLARRAARPGSRLPGDASRRAPPERLPGALPGRGCRGSPSWRLSPRARAQPGAALRAPRSHTQNSLSSRRRWPPRSPPRARTGRAGISLVGQ